MKTLLNSFCAVMVLVLLGFGSHAQAEPCGQVATAKYDRLKEKEGVSSAAPKSSSGSAAQASSAATVSKPNGTKSR